MCKRGALTMKIIVDSREQRWEHIREYFDKNGIEYTVKKLDTADYMIEGKPNVRIDRKKDCSELSHNLLNAKDHSRFWKEIRRAREQGIKLFILCEHGGKIKSIKDVAFWNDKYSGVSGRALMNEIYRVSISYGVEFIFCSKRETARKIIEILTEREDKK